MKVKPCNYCLGTGVHLDRKSTGKKMRKIRLAAGIGMRQLARQLKVSAPYVCDLEFGRVAWNIKMANAYKALRTKGSVA